MINLDELEGVCDAMIEEGLDWCPPAGCGSAVQVKELIGMLRNAEADAKRYQWLKDCALRNHIHSLIMVHPDEWDLFNDEAMSHEAS